MFTLLLNLFSPLKSRFISKSITMIHFMLNDLHHPSCKCFYACLKLVNLPSYFDRLISLTQTGTAKKRKVSFFGVIRTTFFIISGLSITVHVGVDSLSSRKEMMRFSNLSYSLLYQHNYPYAPSTYQVNFVPLKNYLWLYLPNFS